MKKRCSILLAACLMIAALTGCSLSLIHILGMPLFWLIETDTLNFFYYIMSQVAGSRRESKQRGFYE